MTEGRYDLHQHEWICLMVVVVVGVRNGVFPFMLNY